MDANKKGSTVFFINDLEINIVFKDKDKKEEASVIDFIYQVLQLLKAELKELVDVV